MKNKPERVAKAFRERYGLEPAGAGALEIMFEEPLDHWQGLTRNGALFRLSLQHAFERIRLGLRALKVQVLHASPGKEFLISDSPAFTFRYEADGAMSLQMAISDSGGIALPLARSCVVAIGPCAKDEVAAPEVVDQLNYVQLLLAERQIYYRPGAPFVKWIQSHPNTLMLRMQYR